MWTQGKEVIVLSSDDEVEDMDTDVTEENFIFKSHTPQNNQTGSRDNHQSMSEPIVYTDERKGKNVIYADMDVDVIHIPTKQEGLVIRDGSRKEDFTDKGKGKAKVVKVHDDLLSMDSNVKDAVRGLMQLLEIKDNNNLGVSRLMEQNQNQDNKVNSPMNKIIAKGFALKLAEELRQKKKTDDLKVAEAGLKLQNNENPRRFENAYEMIIKRAEQKRRAILLNDIVHRVPCSSHSSSKAKKVPSLLDLSCDILAKNVEKLMSLKLVPDELRSKLSQAVSDYRKLDANFVQLLVKGDPVEIRVRDGSYLKEEDLLMIFSDFDAKWLTFLQLDLCGNALSDEGLRKIVIQSLGILPSLVKVSLRAAYRLTDRGLNLLAQSTPELQSLNLTESGLITNDGINNLTSYLGSKLRELYLDDCENLDAMAILPALKQFKNLEVLSVTAMPNVCDSFVIQLVATHGKNIKELVLANCVELTDMSIEAVANACPELHALDISWLSELTDYVMQYLADGCSSIQRLKLHRNTFSDEAVAAFLETSGQSLTELSLNHVGRVGPNTALALSKCARNLSTLDLSWCREITDEALCLIVDSCSSLKLLKIFGCSQITENFINGHPNLEVEILGLPLTSLKTSWIDRKPSN